MAFGVRGDVERAHRAAHLGEPAVRIRAGDADEARRIGIRERREEDAVHEAVDGGVGADPERQGEHGHGRERRAAPQHARAEAQVLRQRIEERRAPGVATPLLGEVEAPEAALDEPPRLAGVHAAGGERIDLLLQVVLDLVVQLAIHGAPPHDRSPSQRHHVEPVFEAHRGSASALRRGSG